MELRPKWRRPMLERFWSKVAIAGPAECWLWTGAKIAGGYGYFTVKRYDVRRAHRLAFDLAHPDAPLGADEFACHRCDNPSCVNPAHLFRGTNLDNMQDAARKGRTRKPRNTHCKRGHAMTPENRRTRINRHKGTRHDSCIACEDMTSLAWRERKRQERKSA